MTQATTQFHKTHGDIQIKQELPIHFAKLPKEIVEKIWIASKNPQFLYTCRHTRQLLSDGDTKRRFYRSLAPEVLVFTALDIPAWYRMKGAQITADLASRVLACGAVAREDLISLMRYEFLDKKAKKKMDPLAVPHSVSIIGLAQLRLRLPAGTKIPEQLRDCKEMRQAIFMNLDDMSRSSPETASSSSSRSRTTLLKHGPIVQRRMPTLAVLLTGRRKL